MKMLRTEEVDGSTYCDAQDARYRIWEFIKQVYNHQRLHTARYADVDYRRNRENFNVAEMRLGRHDIEIARKAIQRHKKSLKGDIASV